MNIELNNIQKQADKYKSRFIILKRRITKYGKNSKVTKEIIILDQTSDENLYNDIITNIKNINNTTKVHRRNMKRQNITKLNDIFNNINSIHQEYNTLYDKFINDLQIKNKKNEFNINERTILNKIETKKHEYEYSIQQLTTLYENIDKKNISNMTIENINPDEQLYNDIINLLEQLKRKIGTTQQFNKIYNNIQQLHNEYTLLHHNITQKIVITPLIIKFEEYKQLINTLNTLLNNITTTQKINNNINNIYNKIETLYNKLLQLIKNSNNKIINKKVDDNIRNNLKNIENEINYEHQKYQQIMASINEFKAQIIQKSTKNEVPMYEQKLPLIKDYKDEVDNITKIIEKYIIHIKDIKNKSDLKNALIILEEYNTNINELQNNINEIIHIINQHIHDNKCNNIEHNKNKCNTLKKQLIKNELMISNLNMYKQIIKINIKNIIKQQNNIKQQIKDELLEIQQYVDNILNYNLNKLNQNNIQKYITLCNKYIVYIDDNIDDIKDIIDNTIDIKVMYNKLQQLHNKLRLLQNKKINNIQNNNNENTQQINIQNNDINSLINLYYGQHQTYFKNIYNINNSIETIQKYITRDILYLSDIIKSMPIESLFSLSNLHIHKFISYFASDINKLYLSFSDTNYYYYSNDLTYSLINGALNIDKTKIQHNKYSTTLNKIKEANERTFRLNYDEFITLFNLKYENVKIFETIDDNSIELNETSDIWITALEQIKYVTKEYSFIFDINKNEYDILFEHLNDDIFNIEVNPIRKINNLLSNLSNNINNNINNYSISTLNLANAEESTISQNDKNKTQQVSRFNVILKEIHNIYNKCIEYNNYTSEYNKDDILKYIKSDYNYIDIIYTDIIYEIMMSIYNITLYVSNNIQFELLVKLYEYINRCNINIIRYIPLYKPVIIDQYFIDIMDKNIMFYKSRYVNNISIKNMVQMSQIENIVNKLNNKLNNNKYKFIPQKLLKYFNNIIESSQNENVREQLKTKVISQLKIIRPKIKYINNTTTNINKLFNTYINNLQQ